MQSSNDRKILYRLAPNRQRSYSILVNGEEVMFSGDFWYLKNKEFVKCRNRQEMAQTRNFLGMGYLAKRSFKKCILFLLAGSALEIVKMIIDKLTEWVDKANDYLQWFGQSISLPEWMNQTMNGIAAICVLLAILLFFSKKKVIEISFTDKRICVPQKSMTQSEYNQLYQGIIHGKKMQNT